MLVMYIPEKPVIISDLMFLYVASLRLFRLNFLVLVQKHLVRVQKTSWFCLKEPVLVFTVEDRDDPMS